ncbi:Zinc finger protein, partial [Gryllus bimaculatus]
MDGQEIVLSESLLKVEEIKEEPEELLEEVDPIEVQETSTSEDVVKEETDDGEVQEASTSKDVLIKEADEQQELEPLAAVFVEALKEEVEEEYKDPLEISNESEETEKHAWFPGGECDTEANFSEPPADGSTFENSDDVCNDDHLTVADTEEKSNVCRHECSICQKSFTTKGSLERHMLIHSGERPYECSVCRKGFAQRIQLVTHMRMHSGERPYECSVCQKGFTVRNTLVRHM